MKYDTSYSLLRARADSRLQDFCAGFFMGGLLVLALWLSQ